MSTDARIASRTIVVRTEGGESLVVWEFTIDCALCGQTEGTVFGHHLKTLHTAIGKVIEAHPELCGPEATVTEVTQFAGVVDPKKASSN